MADDRELVYFVVIYTTSRTAKVLGKQFENWTSFNQSTEIEKPDWQCFVREVVLTFGGKIIEGEPS